MNSLLDDTTIDMKNIEKEEDMLYVGLYHGSIKGWRNNFDYVSSVGEANVDDFSGLDVVLLGDIHLFQVMNDRNPLWLTRLV